MELNINTESTPLKLNITSAPSMNVSTKPSVRLELGKVISFNNEGAKTVSGTPFASAKDNVLTLYMYTLKQLEELSIHTSAGVVKFTITLDENNYYLAYSDDSPAPIDGAEIQDDVKFMYEEDYLFKSLILTFPDGWTIRSVFFEDAENLLGEGDAWRLADIQRKIAGGELVLATDAEYAAFKSHVETEIANILTPITEE